MEGKVGKAMSVCLSFVSLFLLLASQRSLQDLSSPTMDRIHALSSESAES